MTAPSGRAVGDEGIPGGDSGASNPGTDLDEVRPLLLPTPRPRGRIWRWVRATILLVAVAAAAATYAAWRFFGPSYSAIASCRTFGQVAWDLDATNWRTRGTTEVNFNAFVRTLRFTMGTPVTRNQFVSYDVDDEGLARLAELPPVQTLDLSGAEKIRGPGLAVLSRLPDLRELTINRSSWGVLRGPVVRDWMLGQIAAGPKLRVLRINGARITDAGLEPIGAMTNLEELDLAWTKVGDAGIAHLKGMARLAKLDLTGTRVTDAGLANLRGLAGLRQLVLHRTKVTAAGVEALGAALPSLEHIDYGGMAGRDSEPKDFEP